MNKKNIVILTGVHPFKDSGRSVYDFKNILNDNGHNVLIVTNSLLFNKKLKNVISVKSIFKVVLSRIIKKISFKYTKHIHKKIDPNFYMIDYNSHNREYDVNKILKKIKFKPDAFIYLFPHNFLNEKSLYELNKITGSPIYRYLVDMAEITGGCHYAWDCEGYIKNCGDCPGLFSEKSNDETYENLKFKKKYIDKTEVYPIVGSEWLMQQLLKSSLYKDKKSYKILLPIDEKVFYNQNSENAKKSLGLPLDKKIIFFGAVNYLEKRKGAKELLNSLKILNQLLTNEISNNIHLAFAGKADETFVNQLEFKSTHLGYLDYKELSKAYNAADVFLCPSIEDSGPSMINQSLMCGTPIVSFYMGVALDLIIDYKTGYKAEIGNCDDFAKGIKEILELNLKNNCLKHAKLINGKEKIYEDLNRLFK
jgi:glycosyltransferase involved in cell wall biosynthesis